MTRRHLVSFLTEDDADLHLARRYTEHDHLVLLATPRQLERATRIADREHAYNGPDAAEVLEVPAHELDTTRARLVAYLDSLPPGDTTVLNIGGDPTHIYAAVMVAFERGLPTVVAQHDRVEALPVLQGLSLYEQFDDIERRLLARLGAEAMPIEHLAQHLLIPKTRLHQAGRRLRDHGMVASDVTDGSTRLALTGHGARMRRHLR